MRIQYRAKQIILLLGDTIMLFAGFWFAQAVRNLRVPEWTNIQALLPLFGVVIGFWLVLNYINGLYDLARAHDKKLSLRRLVETALLALVVGITYFYLSPDGRITPKTTLLLAVLFGYFLSWIWRLVHMHFLGADTLQQRILFIGYNPVVEELLNILDQDKAKGYKATAILCPKHELAKEKHNINIYDDVSKIRSIINSTKAHIVVVSPELRENKTVQAELYELLFWPVHITDITSMYELLTGRITPTAFSEAWFLDHLKRAETPVYNKVRRVVDILAVIAIGIIFAILFIPVALAIKLTSKGPLFYKQSRIGKGGTTFMLYKFRSMYALTADGGAEIDGVQFAKKQDKRITKVGKILRKTRIDELPQIWNLIRQDVTLIGPRPERPEIVSQLTEQMPYYRLRHVVQPGLTGWAVLHQNYTDDLETSLQKLQYDLYYIKNRSILLDISIMLKTINLILRARGQ